MRAAIVALYGHGQQLYYAGTVDVAGSSRHGVYKFTATHDWATVFPDFFPALRMSWRAVPPRKYQGAMLTSIKVDELT
jgi:hypothetical protein